MYITSLAEKMGLDLLSCILGNPLVPSCMAASLELDYIWSGWGQGLFWYVLGQGTLLTGMKKHTGEVSGLRPDNLQYYSIQAEYCHYIH